MLRRPVYYVLVCGLPFSMRKPLLDKWFDEIRACRIERHTIFRNYIQTFTPITTETAIPEAIAETCKPLSENELRQIYATFAPYTPPENVVNRYTQTVSNKRVKPTMPLAPDAYGCAKLPDLEPINPNAEYADAIGVDFLSALQLKFPRNWRETISLAFLVCKLRPHLSIQARVDYVTRRYLIERTGAHIRHGRIVRIAKTNQEIELLAKLVQTKNEAKAKQLRFETAVDGTRDAVWQEIRAILGDELFTALQTLPLTEAIASCSTPARTLYRKLANVRARIIRP